MDSCVPGCTSNHHCNCHLFKQMQKMRHKEGKLLVHSHPAGGGRAGLRMKTTCLQSPPPNTLLGQGEGLEHWNTVPSQDWLETLLHPTHQRTSLPGLCSLSPRPSAPVSPGGRRWAVPGACLPSTRPPAHTWGETGPVLPPLSLVFTEPPLPRKLECKEQVCCAGGVSLFPVLVGRPDSASWGSG